MYFGEEDGVVGFRDGRVLGPDSIELNMEDPANPLWRFRRSRAAKKKKGTRALIPVRRAYESLVEFLAAAPMSAQEWDEASFPLANAKGFRAFTVGIDDRTVVGSFFAKSRGWFQEVALEQKPSWEEATGTSNVIPDSLSDISVRQFVACFGRKSFSLEDANKLLGTSRLPSLPKDLVSEEFAARSALLNCLNVSISLEAIILQAGQDSEVAAATAAALKMSLQPLWLAFNTFAKKRVELRTKALEGCNKENPHVRRLISSPFSAELFGAQAIEDLQSQALHQAKAALVLLEFKAGQKRAGDYVPRFNKRARGQGYVPRYGRFNRQPYFRRSGSRSPSRGRGKSPLRYPGTPGKGFYWSPGCQYYFYPGQYGTPDRNYQSPGRGYYPEYDYRGSGRFPRRSSPRGRGRGQSPGPSSNRSQSPSRGRRQF